MRNDVFQSQPAQALAAAREHLDWARTKVLLAVMAGAWLGYFIAVHSFVHQLNKIAVPLLGIPLGFYLAVQGAAVVFAIALFRFARSELAAKHA